MKDNHLDSGQLLFGGFACWSLLCLPEWVLLASADVGHVSCSVFVSRPHVLTTLRSAGHYWCSVLIPSPLVALLWACSSLQYSPLNGKPELHSFFQKLSNPELGGKEGPRFPRTCQVLHTGLVVCSPKAQQSQHATAVTPRLHLPVFSVWTGVRLGYLPVTIPLLPPGNSCFIYIPRVWDFPLIPIQYYFASFLNIWMWHWPWKVFVVFRFISFFFQKGHQYFYFGFQSVLETASKLTWVQRSTLL